LGVTPPAPQAARRDRLRFVRDFQIRWFAVGVMLEILAVLCGVRATTILFPAIGTVVLALDIAWLTVKTRRTQ
jgi:hypothetical protein